MTVDKYNYMDKGELRNKIRELEAQFVELESYLRNEFPQIWERIEFNRRQKARGAARRKWVDRHDGTGEHLEDVEE